MATQSGTRVIDADDNPYATSKNWSRKVSIDTDFLNNLTSGIKAVPNTRSGRTPSLGEVTRGLTAPLSSPKQRTKGKWKAGFLVTGKAKNSLLSPSASSAQPAASFGGRIPSRERRGTIPAALNLTGSTNRLKDYLGVTDAVFAGSKFRKLLLKRRMSSQESQDRRWSRSSAEGPPDTPKSPDSPKKSFKEFARQALFQRRVSEGVQTGKSFSLGDVFMQELYKQVDKKKMAKLRHIASLQAVLNEKRRLLRKFRMAGRIVVWCITTCKRHCLKVAPENGSQESTDLSSFFNMNFSAMDTFEGVDLLFDPSKFKANRKARISKETKRIFRKRPEDRTPQELYYAQIALRNIKCFSEFPDRMHKKIAEAGVYHRYEARRVLLRQGHPAHAFYFILSGSVSVLVVEESSVFAKVMAQLEKGQSFGELAIITRGNRQSSVVVKEKSEFLSISVDDYHRIFISGGVKSVNDPDHELFVKSLPFLQGWPLKKLHDETAKCVFLYFKRGDVIVRDSQYSDWIIVVKSGSLAVLKKLRKVEAYEWKKPKGFVFVSDKEKRERQEKLTKLRKQVLPELQVPLKADHSTSCEDGQIRAEGRLRPFVHPDGHGAGPAVVVSDGTSDTKVWDLGSAGFSGSGLDSLSYVHVPGDKSAVGTEQTKDIRSTDDARPTTGGSLQSDSLLPGRKSRECRVISPVTGIPDESNLVQTGNEEHFVSAVRTIQQELEENGVKKDPDDITAADLNPEFVHVQTLTKGMCFGLTDLILGQQCSFCVVSNGADVILVNKQMYHEHASEGLLRRMRQDLCPYPSEEELQTRLQTSVDWDAYRQTALADTLKSVRMRKQLRV